MRNAAIVLMVAALAACEAETASLTDAEERPEAVRGTLPVSELLPPLWRIDPARDPHGAILDGVPDDPEHGIPESLRGLRASVNGDQWLRYEAGRFSTLPEWVSPPALSREDFRRGSRKCLHGLVEEYRAGASPWFLRSVERQTHWYVSMRAKEAVYGVGAEEAACERILLQHALHVARGDWPKLYDGHPYREEILESLANEAEWGYPPEDDFPASAEDAARLEEWLK